ncbi:hypothetical protein BGX23_005220 [Mortierella sp. AD031]|nr:hypothetical protein BGX23_005220 [Mortierella sp. AD031]KAG0219575.1 hypothetical protein BGX33_002122 [Mortierella sp. NVP41]
MTPMTPMDTMSTAANRFFDVPELVCLLTEHMGPKEHRALTLTSCFLRTIFEPIIYHSLDMTYRSGRAYLLESPHAQQALARNVSSVRSLKLGRVDTACLYNCFLAHQRTIRTHGTVSPDSARLPPWLPRRNNTEFREVPLAPMFNLTKLEIDFTRTDDDMIGDFSITTTGTLCRPSHKSVGCFN